MEQTPTSVTVKIAPNQDVAIARYVEQAEGLLGYAQDRNIRTADDVQSATEDLNLIANLKKAMDEKKAEYLGPLNTHVKEVNATFKLLMEPILEADRLTRDKVMEWRADEKRKAEEAEEINRLRLEADRKEAAANDGVISESAPPIEVPATPARRVETAVGTAGIQKVRKWEVVSFADLPDDYKVADAGRITKQVKAGIGAIPGLRIYEEEVLTVKPR